MYFCFVVKIPLDLMEDHLNAGVILMRSGEV